MASVWLELKRRNVVRVAVAYIVVSWVLLQASDVLIPLLILPEWVGKLVFFLLVIGFPLALVFAWAYELTPVGLKKEKDIVRSESITHITGRKLDFVIIAVLGLALVFFAVERFVWQPSRIPASSGTTQIVATGFRHSIAVLPFINMSDDPSNEYFSDGLSEEILNLLARIPELKVIARTSSFAFKGKNEDIRVIGEALGAKTVLEGSVRKAGDRVRITVQLIDVADGSHIWSDTYDRTMTDIFEVQDDVADAIFDALQLHVGARPTRGRPTDSTEAYSLFLKARAIMNARESPRSAEAILLEAVELDPGFAEAYELLGFVYWYQAGSIVTAATGQRQAADAAAEALAIDPDLVFARALFQSANIEDYSFIGEIQALKNAAREAPSHTELLDALVYDMVYAGYLEEALAYAERYVDLDPLSADAHSQLAATLVSVDRMDEALAALELVAQFGGAESKQQNAMWQFLLVNDDSAITQLEAVGDRPLVAWPVYRELVAGARDLAAGQAYLDRRIPEILASTDAHDRYFAQLKLTDLYLHLGFLDRYFELILDRDLTGTTWSDADNWIYTGTILRRTGFTAHPRYLEVAELTGIIDVWEQRGPPDFCEKIAGKWTCE
jgi:TolB-like protein